LKLLCPRWRVSPHPTRLRACRPGSASTFGVLPRLPNTPLAPALGAIPNLQSRGFHFIVMPRQCMA